MLIIVLFPFISLFLSIWLAFYKPCLFLTPNDLFAMRHLGKKDCRMWKKTVYFARKTCLLLLSTRKTIKFAISHSFIIFYLFLTGPIPLRIRFLLLLPKRKNSHSFLSLSLSLSLSLHTRSRITRKKRKKEEINDVAVTFTDLLRIILLPCLFLSTCCWLFIFFFVYALVEISDLFLSSVLWLP